MNKTIENPADCEVQAVVHFLNTKNTHPGDIHQVIVSVYGKEVMSKSNLKKWYHLFNEGRNNILDE